MIENDVEYQGKSQTEAKLSRRQNLTFSPAHLVSGGLACSGVTRGWSPQGAFSA